jgi:cytochrome c oxidase subunit 1
MGMAGLEGMLRRHFYMDGEYQTFMILAAISAVMMLVGWVIFLVNIIMSVGLKGLIEIFLPAKDDTATFGIDPQPSVVVSQKK